MAERDNEGKALDAALAYDRSDRLELRRSVMTRSAQFVVPQPSDNVIELRRAGA
jgi:hypothetical protein